MLAYCVWVLLRVVSYTLCQALTEKPAVCRYNQFQSASVKRLQFGCLQSQLQTQRWLTFVFWLHVFYVLLVALLTGVSQRLVAVECYAVVLSMIAVKTTFWHNFLVLFVLWERIDLFVNDVCIYLFGFFDAYLNHVQSAFNDYLSFDLLNCKFASTIL